MRCFSKCLVSFIVLTGYFNIVQSAPNDPLDVGEIHTHTTMALDQAVPAVARDAAGNFVVVWQSAQFDPGGGIYLQRFVGGLPLGEVAVIDGSTDPETQPDVAMAADGRFVVIWTFQLGTRRIQARTFNADGTPNSGIIDVSAVGDDITQASAVAMSDAGDFAVVWTLGTATQMRMFDFNANEIDPTQTVNGVALTAPNTPPDVAMNMSGQIVVVWEGRDGLNRDADGVYLRRFDASGSPINVTDALVNVEITGIQSEPKVAIDNFDRLAVVWSGPTAADNTSILMRRFSFSAGALDGADIQVNDPAPGFQQNSPAIATDDNGDLILVWRHEVGDTVNRIFARGYNDDFSDQGTQFQVSQNLQNDYDVPDVAVDAFGNYIVVWQRFHIPSASQDTFVRRFEGPAPDGTPATPPTPTPAPGQPGNGSPPLIQAKAIGAALGIEFVVLLGLYLVWAMRAWVSVRE